MADTTTHESELSRAETAAMLRDIADEMDGGSGPVRVSLGNKDVSLSPPDTVTAETTVTERRRRLRRDVEELRLHFRWSPTRRAGSGDADAETEDADTEVARTDADTEAARGGTEAARTDTDDDDARGDEEVTDR